MFSTSSTQATAPTKATGVSIQTSVEGKPIPVVYGRRRIAPNILWGGDFVAVANEQNSGGMCGGSATTKSYTYFFSFLMGICEGPVSLVRGWVGSKVRTLAKLGYDVFKSGARTQDAWGYFDETSRTVRWSTGPVQVIPGGHAAEKAYYPGIAYCAWANKKLGNSASLPNYNFEVNGFCRYKSGSDCNPATVIKDYLTNQYYGCGFPEDNLSALTLYSKWCLANGLLIATEFTEQSAARDQIEEIIEMTCAAPVWTGSFLKIIPYGETKVAGNGYTYTPPNWTGVNLTTDDFKPLGDNEGLVRITRKDRASMYNAVRLEGVRRNHSYNVHIESAQDDLSIQTWGYRPEDVQQAHFFNTATIIAKAAELRLRRLAIATTFEFKLGWEHIALEPMDIVTLTEPFLGLEDVPVRITEIQEDEDGYLSITAEEVLEGTYVTSDATKVTDFGVSASESDQEYGYVGGEAEGPGNVNEPVVFEPDKSLTLGTPTIIFSVSGAGESWGGAEVWASLDGDAFSYLGNVGAAGNGSSSILGSPGRQGVVSVSAFPSGSDPDTVNSLTVDTSESGAELSSFSQDQADAHESLAYVGGELIAPTAATLQEDGTYLLDTYIRRGLFASSIGSHAVGSKFCPLDDASIAKYIYPTSWIGKTIHFKFASFDIYGDQTQDLDDCTAYSLAVSGASYSYVDSATVDTLETTVGSLASALLGHIADTDNPHETTKSHVGLGNVDDVQQMPLSYLDTDSEMAANSDARVPSQKAVVAYVAANGGGGAARGLYSGLLSEDVPTQANTGFSTWVNQGNATVSDNDAGMTLYMPYGQGNISALIKDAPNTPYTITALIAKQALWRKNYPAVEFGWYDTNTGKIQSIHWGHSDSGIGFFGVTNWNSYQSWSADVYITTSFIVNMLWLRLKDNGTTVYFQYSIDGVNWITWYYVAKSSGFLGSSGYNKILFGGSSATNSALYNTLMSYAEISE